MPSKLNHFGMLVGVDKHPFHMKGSLKSQPENLDIRASQFSHDTYCTCLGGESVGSTGFAIAIAAIGRAANPPNISGCLRPDLSYIYLL